MFKMVLTTLPRGSRRIWPKIYTLVCVEPKAGSEISPLDTEPSQSYLSSSSSSTRCWLRLTLELWLI